MGTLHGPALYAVASFGYLLTLILVPLRCVARLRVVHRLALEDYIMIAAQIINLGGVGTTGFAITYYGAGEHYSQLSEHTIQEGLKWWWVAMLIYPIVSALVKLSISLLLLRLMASRLQKAVIYIVMMVTIAIGIATTGYTAGFCSPTPAFWHRKFDQCNLHGLEIVVYVQSAINLATDVALAVMPAVVLAKSQLPRKQKIATAGVLAIGVSAGLATVARMAFTHTITNGDDFLYSSVWLGFASALETSFAITAGCLATFRPFFVKVKGRSIRPEDSVGAAGQLTFKGTADTVRGAWDPGLTINIGANRSDDAINEISRPVSRSDSDFSLPMQMPGEKDDHEEFKGPIYSKELKLED